MVFLRLVAFLVLRSSLVLRSKLLRSSLVLRNKLLRSIPVLPNKLFRSILVLPNKLFRRILVLLNKLFRNIPVLSSRCVRCQFRCNQYLQRRNLLNRRWHDQCHFVRNQFQLVRMAQVRRVRCRSIDLFALTKKGDDQVKVSEREEVEEDIQAELVRQAPPLLTSMIVHIILVLVLVLIATTKFKKGDSAIELAVEEPEIWAEDLGDQVNQESRSLIRRIPN